MFRAFIILMLLCTGAQAQEIVSNLDNTGKVVINEELRKSRQSIRDLEDSIVAMLPIDLSLYGTSVTNFLPITGGGTGAGTAQGAINALTQVSSATNEHVLTKDTSTGNAIYKAITPAGLTLISTTTVTAANSSANIAFNKDKNYKIIVSGLGASADTNDWQFTTNGSGQSFLATAGEENPLIIVEPAANNNQGAWGEITIYKQVDIGGTYYINPMSVFVGGMHSSNRSISSARNVHLRVNGSPPTLTTFAIKKASGNWTGTIWLYEITQ